MTTHSIPIVPFDLPSAVSLQLPNAWGPGGFKPLPSIVINSLPRDTVVQLCAEFTSKMLAAYDQQQHEAESQAQDDRSQFESFQRR